MAQELSGRNMLVTEDDQRKPAEISPGVIVERRRLLWLPAVAASSLLVRAGAIAAQEEMSRASRRNPLLLQPSELAWDAFLEQSQETAAGLHVDSSAEGQEAYLSWLALMASRLRLETIPDTNLGRYEELDPAIYFGPSFLGQPFSIIQWRMEAGAYLPPHCHPNASVCTVGIEGEARIRNFEIQGEAPEFSSSASFRVRETHNEIIAPRRINTLSSLRDNIHTFQAGKSGARGMDISTYHGENIGFSFLRLGERAVDPQRRIFEAVWTAV
jgi:hypothetical protein